MKTLSYLAGFGNHFESEAEPGALIKGRNSPQKVPFGLYGEQLSGTAFTKPRNVNRRSWLYRIRPSVVHGAFAPMELKNWLSTPFKNLTPPTQMRWDPFPYHDKNLDFIESIFTFAGNGDTAQQIGSSIHMYAATRSMTQRFFYNADAEMLIVPQQGKLQFDTEFGVLVTKPGEILVIPRGVKFKVQILEKKARGYICENYGLQFRLPELGVLGANALANPRDFLAPAAAYENLEEEFELVTKFHGAFWHTTLNHSPLDVVAWHGNYVPYKYDLSLFNVINSVSYDHPDPSVFTVLTSPSDIEGVANVDFVIFPPRWMVAEDTFRPPYFHRNIMSECMGLIYGKYDAKNKGFLPGGLSLHNCMSAHGPDKEAYEKAVNSDLQPEYYADTLAFMFESRHIWQLTEQAICASFIQSDYLLCWKGLKCNYDLSQRSAD